MSALASMNGMWCFYLIALIPALSAMVEQQPSLVAFTINVETKEEDPHPFFNEAKKMHMEPVKAVVYVICKQSHKDEVIKRIKKFARTPYRHDTKEAVLLNQTIRKKTEVKKGYCDDYVGWLELNNAFMFFTDKGTFEKMCKLFELEA